MEDCGVIHSWPGNSSSSSSPLLLSILHLRATSEAQCRVDAGKERSLGVRRDRTEWREDKGGGAGGGVLEVEWSAVTGSHPPAATRRVGVTSTALSCNIVQFFHWQFFIQTGHHCP